MAVEEAAKSAEKGLNTVTGGLYSKVSGAVLPAFKTVSMLTGGVILVSTMMPGGLTTLSGAWATVAGSGTEIGTNIAWGTEKVTSMLPAATQG